MQRAFIKSNKDRCRGKSLVSSKFCFRHDPGSAASAQEASKLGGQNRNSLLSFTEEVHLTSPSEVQDFITRVINSIWQGKVPAKLVPVWAF